MGSRWQKSDYFVGDQDYGCTEQINQGVEHHHHDGGREDPGGCRLYNSLLEMMPSKPPCRKLYPGDLILIEPPLIFVPDKMDGEATAALLEVLMSRMSQVQREAVLYLNDSKNPDDPDNLGRFYTNAMSYGEDAVLCPIMARANHSCRPNAEFVTRKDLGLNHLRAIYPIEEEGREARQAYLRRSYDFECICSACNLRGKRLDADEGLRESLRQMRERGIDLLTDQEVDVFLAGLYTIQAKLSYIFEVVEQVWLSCSHPQKKSKHCLHSRTLLCLLYGNDSTQVHLWDERARNPDSTKEPIDWDVCFRADIRRAEQSKMLNQNKFCTQIDLTHS